MQKGGGRTVTNRCSWVKLTNPLYVAYHDEEWGRPQHDDRALFEQLCLETYQAGLSWETVLNKRAAFRSAFYHYDPQQVALMTDADLEDLLQNPDLIRHRGKLWATRSNAQAFLRVQAEFGQFATYLWAFGHGRAGQLTRAEAQVLAENLSKDLKKRGFKFTGPVCVYAYLQATGILNDHEDTCDFRQEGGA